MNVNTRVSGYPRRFNGIGKVLSSTDGPCIKDIQSPLVIFTHITVYKISPRGEHIPDSY